MNDAQKSVTTASILNESSYRGWKSRQLSNGLIELQVVPEIGGRIIQFGLGKKEFLWVNPKLAGKLPTPSGLAADGSWLNYGGDKLWPAPQGWDNDQQWPGPPDAVLDGQPYEAEKVQSGAGEAALRLTSRKDLRSGVQFSREIRIFDGSTHVSFEATMKNIDIKPRRWGIWAHTQLDAANPGRSSYNKLMNAWCPVNPNSKLPAGYSVIFGEKDNPSYQPDPLRGLMRVQYQYKVGKIGLDSHAGWSATVDGATGAVFVQRFTFEPGKDYPDGSSVEFWMNGKGKIHAYNKEMVQAADAAVNPYVFESEVISPFAKLDPGQSYTWRYDWYATNIGGDFPVVDCNPVSAIAQPLRADICWGKVSLKGRFGLFITGSATAVFTDAAGQIIQTASINPSVSPLRPFLLDTAFTVPDNASMVRLIILDGQGKPAGEITHCDLQKVESVGRWPAERAKDWYDRQPWLVGCNFLPSTAVNDVEMWQSSTFDPATIDRELGWAKETGFNSVRVFVNYVVWEADAAGLKKRFDQFLQIASRHGISTMVILLDDCFKQNPKVGKQEDPVPGVHNSQWVASPGRPVIDDQSKWPRLEAYVKDMVSTFASDPRVVIWDLYNEPTVESAALAEACLDWARQVKPLQPLTIGAWEDFSSAFTRRLIEASDIISFHGYDPTDGVLDKMQICAAFGRPVICTEWLVRREGNTVETLLPIFRDRRIGCWNWGLVAGRMQTYYPWGSPKNAPMPKQWQHDIFRKDGTPYSKTEIQLIKELTGKVPLEKKASGEYQEKEVIYHPKPWLPVIWKSNPPYNSPFEKSEDIVGLAFTRKYVTYTDADTFYPSWSGDDNMYCGWADGEIGLENVQSSGKEKARSGIVKIEGSDPMNLKITSMGTLGASALPYGGRYTSANLVYDGIWYYGTFGLDFDFTRPEYVNQYSWAICGPLAGFSISRDFGKTWTPSPYDLAKPLMPESGRDGRQVKMGAPHFVDFGKNMQNSPDGKAYLVGQGALDEDPTPRVAGNSLITGDALYMARVTPSPENINDISKYEFFAGFDRNKAALWTSDFSKIRPFLSWNDGLGSTTITYNPGLKRYIMCITDGWPGMQDMNSYLLESEQITGPYKLITYMRSFGRQGYFLNLPTRFIGENGRTAWLSYSANFNNVYFCDRSLADPIGSRYAWNLQEILLLDKDMKKRIEGFPEEQIDPIKKKNNIALRSRVAVSSVNKKFRIFTEQIAYFGEGAVDGMVPDAEVFTPTGSEMQFMPSYLIQEKETKSPYVFHEWVSDGEKGTAMIRLNWNQPEKVSRVWLFDRPNLKDQVTSGMLLFSDGSTINVSELPNDARSCREISFPEKTITWMAFFVNTVSATTTNAGLAEFAVFKN